MLKLIHRAENGLKGDEPKPEVVQPQVAPQIVAPQVPPQVVAPQGAAQVVEPAVPRYLLHECVFRGDVRQLSALIRQGQDLALQVLMSMRKGQCH